MNINSHLIETWLWRLLVIFALFLSLVNYTSNQRQDLDSLRQDTAINNMLASDYETQLIINDSLKSQIKMTGIVSRIQDLIAAKEGLFWPD